MAAANKTKQMNQLTEAEGQAILKTLEKRFDDHMERHSGIDWEKVAAKLTAQPEKLWSLAEMEKTGGEPDLVRLSAAEDDFIFYDCAKESPVGRRSLCYDNAAREARKANKPVNSALGLAHEMGIEVLTEEDYRALQKAVHLDEKTSSWVLTPEPIRKLGGALFCDRRYNTVFTYHNGADSYYAARGFRGRLRV